MSLLWFEYLSGWEQYKLTLFTYTHTESGRPHKLIQIVQPVSKILKDLQEEKKKNKKLQA